MINAILEVLTKLRDSPITNKELAHEIREAVNEAQMDKIKAQIKHNEAVTRGDFEPLSNSESF